MKGDKEDFQKMLELVKGNKQAEDGLKQIMKNFKEEIEDESV